MPSYAGIIEMTNWSDFKTICLTQKQLVLQYTEDAEKYDIYAFDSGIWHIILPKNTSDALNFETNYKSTANAKSYHPFRLVDINGTSQGDNDHPINTKLAAGTNNIGDVDVLTLPNVTLNDLPHLNLDSITGVKGIGVFGSDGTSLRWLKVDSTGALQTAIVPTPNTYFNFGDVATAALTQAVVRRTAYTEQTTNAQRSIASASANDAAAGTGAGQVEIIYCDQTGAGPYTETLTLNGTTGVNTVATNICFIEKMTVTSVGSGGSNAGIITLYSAVAKGGVAIGTIALGDNKTFWTHHYVATGRTLKLTGISCSHNGTTVGSGALFFLKAKTIGVATAPENQISDFVRLYGQSSTFSRNYNSPIAVTGPSRLIMYVTPESTSSFIYRSSFDYNEA